MRLRNSILGLIAVCFFAGCSNEEDTIGPVVQEEGTASLSVQIANVNTKAVGDTKIDDKTIDNLCVLIFKGTEGDPKLEKLAFSQEGENISSVEDIPITSGNKKVLVLANVTKEQLDGVLDGENGTPYTTVLAKTLTYTGREVNGTLSMNSKVYDVTLTVSEKNYLGYANVPSGGVSVVGTDVNTPVLLYRNVSQIVLKKIEFEPNTRYHNARLNVKSVFVLHGHKGTKLIGEEGAQWGSTNITGDYLNGAKNEDYAGWVAYMANYENQKLHNYIENIEASPYSPYIEGGNTYFESTTNLVLDNTNPWKDDDYQKGFYVYENTDVDADDIHTLLVIKADFIYKDSDGKDVTSADRYYTVAVGMVDEGYTLPDAFSGSRDDATLYKGALRNLSYNVTLTIAGPGYATPFGPKNTDDTDLGVKVEVKDLVRLYQSVSMGGE